MKRQLRAIYEQTVGRLSPRYERVLEHAVGASESLLDVGCGSHSPVGAFAKKIRQTVGLDAHAPSIEASKARGIHDRYIQGDIRKTAALVGKQRFACVLASDVIEHLEKQEGIEFLHNLERVATQRVIIFTPNGFVPQGEYDHNPWQLHRSGWTVEDFTKRGYRVIGIGGWKPLKGEYGQLRFWPQRLWYLIADLTQPFVRSRPERAYQLLAIKEL